MSKAKQSRQLPRILSQQVVAESRLFRIEQLDLEFSNGATRTYERMQGGNRGAVMVIPLIDDSTMLLIREYSAGTHNYQLGFPKGLIDPGETGEVAANRELKEEIGYGANNLQYLHDLALAPGYFNAKMSVFVARDLYEQSLLGDEPEPLEVVSWPLSDYQRLLQQPDFTEARSIAALLLLQNALKESL